jgi:hypothetical protein
LRWRRATQRLLPWLLTRRLPFGQRGFANRTGGLPWPATRVPGRGSSGGEGTAWQASPSQGVGVSGTAKPPNMVGTMATVTTREKFDRLVDQLSGPSLKAEYARLLREREIDRQVVESYERTPQFEPDGWTDLEEANRSSRRATLGRLDDEERAAGHGSW